MVERLEAADVLALEPAISPDVVGGWHVHHGHRLAPAALTVALAALARARWCDTTPSAPCGSAATGSPASSPTTTRWRPTRCSWPRARGRRRCSSPSGSLPIVSARGWLVRLDAPGGVVRHLVASAGWEEATGRWGTARSGRATSIGLAATATLLHPTSDGASPRAPRGSRRSRRPADDHGVPEAIVAGAIRMVPSLADAGVRSAWWGIRPMTPDERPLVGRLGEGSRSPRDTARRA